MKLDIDKELVCILENKDEKLLTSVISTLINDPNVSSRLENKKIRLSIEDDLTLPVSIFSDKLGMLETIVKFLHENKNLKFKKIGELLFRSQANAAVSYQKAKKKYPQKIKGTDSDINIPVSIFRQDFTCFESISLYLRDALGLSFVSIGKIIGRHEKTVFTIYRRALAKRGGQK